MIRVVSSFNRKLAELYGREFLRGCNQWGIPLTLVHFENFSDVLSYGETRIDASREGPGHDAQCWRFQDFCAEHVPYDYINYRYQVSRFAWKVFAQTRKDIRQGADWLVWLDADVEISGAPDWETLLWPEADVCYLGRREWDHSECGFVAYNLQQRGEEVLDTLREMYITYSVFGEQQWHDSWIFDRVCEQLGVTRHNLSPEAKGRDAWEASPLAAWSYHMKGQRKFQ